MCKVYICVINLSTSFIWVHFNIPHAFPILLIKESEISTIFCFILFIFEVIRTVLLTILLSDIQNFLFKTNICSLSKYTKWNSYEIDY